jgi:membrane protease subunit HflK
VISEAEGYAIERVNRSKGETARFTAVLAQYRDAPAVTRARLYLEALSDALPRIGSVLVMQEGQISPLPLLNLRDAQPRPQAARTAVAQPMPQAPSQPEPRQQRNTERER